MRNTWYRIPRFFRNIYFVTFLAFVVWMAFFDENNMISQYELKQELKQLEEDRSYYLQEIDRTREELEELMTNDAKLEKFARERYLMKKDNEVIFVIVKDKG